MRTIALEEHFVSPDFVSGPGKEFMARWRSGGPRGMQIHDRLLEVGDKRIAEMDAAGLTTADTLRAPKPAPGVIATR